MQGLVAKLASGREIQSSRGHRELQADQTRMGLSIHRLFFIVPSLCKVLLCSVSRGVVFILRRVGALNTAGMTL